MNEETEFPFSVDGVINDVFSSGEIPIAAAGTLDSDAQAAVVSSGSVQLIIVCTD
jgi:hypothetical protein